MNTMAMATESKSENNQLPPPHPIPNPAAAGKMNRTGNGILIIGATGFIGRFVAEASLAAGYATYLLARPGSSNPSKDMALRSLQESGATVIHLFDRGLMVGWGHKNSCPIPAVFVSRIRPNGCSLNFVRHLMFRCPGMIGAYYWEQ